MRARHVRLFSMSDASSESDAPQLRVAEVTMGKPAELTWWDWTVFLLQTAAEIEHALLVQYLYAAYSLAGEGFAGPAVPADAGTLARGWQRTIVGIAREEMAHLLTVQNLLRFIGGPLNVEREDLPFRTFLYPFPFELEPLTKTSLAKYVAAEMPAEPQQPRALIQEIIDRATGATGGLAINRVGVLYDTLGKIFGDVRKLADADLRLETATRFQASADDWFGFAPLIVRAVGSRDDAVRALHNVGAQGEGSATPSAGEPPSHFDRFLGIYTAFPQTEGPGPVTWLPTRPVPRNPNTLPDPTADAAFERGRITHPTSRLWAHLGNVRYRMLLVDMAHALQLPGPLADNDGTPTTRGLLRDWTFAEMRVGIRATARTLTTLPLKQTPAPGDAANAGPPFELPYTLALPDDERDRWRLHLALLDASRALIGDIVAASGPSDVLARMEATDRDARAVVEAQLQHP
jgi:Ferritin-like